MLQVLYTRSHNNNHIFRKHNRVQRAMPHKFKPNCWKVEGEKEKEGRKEGRKEKKKIHYDLYSGHA